MAIQVVPCQFYVPFEELKGSPEESFSLEWQGVGVRRTLQCTAGHRLSLINSFLGWVGYVGTDIIIHRPHVYGDISNLLTACTATTKPFGQMSNVPGDARFADYPHCIVEIGYRILESTLAAAYGQVSIRETLNDAGEFVTLPTKGLYWGTGGEKEGIDEMDAPGKVNKLLEWTVDIRGAVVVPANVWGHPGKINSAEITAPTIGVVFPPGTLLCGNPTIVKEVSFTTTTYDITLRFLAKQNGTFIAPKGWNFFPRISAAGSTISYERITDGTDNKDFYASADFNDIIP